jgi:pimeloyl-ACP methyl ester carboxylesterase
VTTSDERLVPFRIAIPEAEVHDLHERLDRTRWPDELPGAGWDYGVAPGYLRELAGYWRTGFDWSAREAELNAFPQFTTTIDGATVHLLHVRSPEPDALPLLITHGWPGSVAEFTRIIGPLTDPAAHGGDPRDAFHVVAPSIPGYGFSGPTTERGWSATRVAEAFATLMSRLGYSRYATQGGDWGSFISRTLGIVDPDRVIGVHLNMLSHPAPTEPDEVAALTDDERVRVAGPARYQSERSGYAAIQSTRPQTLSYALADSPVGQLAWIVDKFYEWTDLGGSPATATPDDVVDRDQLLTNVSIYWFTRTGGSSARLYYETRLGPRDPRLAEPGPVPVGMAVFPHDIVVPVRRFAERVANITHWTEFERGGHFAAMEQPDLLVADIRDFLRPLR